MKMNEFLENKDFKAKIEEIKGKLGIFLEN